MRKENILERSAIKDILTASGKVYLQHAQSLLSKVLGTKILYFQREALGSKTTACKTVKTSKFSDPSNQNPN